MIILCDNLGYGDVGPFGGALHRTPLLDRMAAEGMRLTDFYVTSGVCTPSRASLLTGCYPRRVNLHESETRGPVLQPVSKKGLHPAEITIAEVVKARGYATACIGKWHLGDQPVFLPTRQGFDEYLGIPYSDDMTGPPEHPNWPPLPLTRNERVVEAPVDRTTLTKRYTEEAIRFMTAHKDRPFFLYLAHATPGSTPAPFVGEAFRGKSKNGPWGDSVEELDWSTGELLAALKRLGLDETTLVIWTSDNGAPQRKPPQGSNRPLSGWGYTTGEGGMRVPCIVRWPGKVPAGTTCRELCSTIDLLPTLAALAGSEAPRDRVIDGRDIRPLLFGQPGAKSPHEAFYYYYLGQLQAVRSGKWKLYLPLEAKLVNFGRNTRPSSAALYDLEADLAETTNVADGHADTVHRLLQLAEKARADLGDTGRPGRNQRPAGRVEDPKPQVLAPAAERSLLPSAVRQTARAIPIVGDVDVLIVGGSTGAVAAGCEAARSGAKVFLVTSCPYLGEDVCATLRLWLDPGEKPASPLAKRLFATTPARPMHIKRTLDQALLDAGVGFLFGCYPTDVLRDPGGRVAGLAMANRAGRQAVRAKILIDATERGTVARLAGAKFHSYPRGAAEFRRVVVGGTPDVGPNARIRRLEGDWFGKDKPNAAFEHTLAIRMEDASYASFAKAEQEARNPTFHTQQLDAADRLFQIPPDAIEGETRMDGPWPGADRLDLNVFRPRGLAHIYLLGGCAAVSREAARELLRPIALMEAGTRVGRAAAREAVSLPRTGEVRVAGEPAPKASSGDVCESLVGIRPIQRGLPTVPSPECGLPVLGRYDVVVIGGGTSGAAAGIGAARHGAKTLVVEYQHGLGGVGTLGLIGNYWHGVRGGFTSEVDQGVARLAARVKVVGKAEWWRRELLRAGAEIWMGALGCGAVVDRGRVCGVVVATPQGRGAVLAKVVIDATGNADVAAAAGAPCAYVDDSDISMQLAGLPARPLGGSYVNTCYMFTDETDLVDLSHLLVYAKDRFREAYDLGTFVDTRERRRIVGDCVLTPVDLHVGRTWPDTISVHASNYDMYGFPVHPLYLLAAPPKRNVIRCYLPYRCLLAKGLEGLLVVGIGLSADRDAMPVIRMQADMQNLGYAAGIAAAMTAEKEKPLRALDVRALQKRLIEVGNLPAEVLGHSDSLPVSEKKLAAAIEGSLESLEHLAIALASAEAALPRVRDAYTRARSEQARLDYARLLAMLGDKTGLDTLLAALERSSWDTGQDIKSSGESGANYSRVDMLILAVGRTRDRRAVGPILAKARQLDPANPLSHFRAVAVALETVGDPAAAPTLAELLRKPGMTGHAVTTVSEARRKRGEEEKGQGRTVRLVNPAIRELVLARALYRCGDERGLAREILQRYVEDLQGPLARHAHAVLHGP